MQVSTTNGCAGTRVLSPLSKSLANFSFRFLNRSMIDMRFSSPGPRDETTASRWERNVKRATSTVALLERSAG
jgi:hypothetical protein